MPQHTSPSFLEILIWILTSFIRNIKKTFLITFLVTTLTIILTFQLDKKYSSESIVHIPSDSQQFGMSAALKSAGALGDMLGMDLGNSSPNTDLMLTILASKELQEKVIKEFNLTKRYKIDTLSKAVFTLTLLAFQKNFVYEINDEGALVISVKDTSAITASQINKRIIQILDSTYLTIMRDRNRESRAFYENRLKVVQTDLQNAQDKLIHYQQNTNILDPNLQIEQSIKTLSEIEAKIMELKMDSTVRSNIQGSYSEDLDEYKSAINFAQKEFEKISNGSNPNLSLGTKSGVKKLPEFFKLKREYMTQETILKLVRQKYEEKLLEENKNFKNLIIIQEPWINYKKVYPARSAIIITIFCLSILFCLVFFLTKESYRRILHSNERLLKANQDLRLAFQSIIKKNVQ